LDELTDKRTSVPATIVGSATTFDLSGGSSFESFAASTTTVGTTSISNATLLASMFKVDIDGTGNPVTVDLSHLATSKTTMTGVTLANEVTKVLNQKFGDETYFDFTDASSKTFVVTSSRVTGATGVPTPVTINLAASTNGLPADMKKVTINQTVAAIQQQLDDSALKTTTAATGSTPEIINKVTVSYDYSTQSFKFLDGTNTVTLACGSLTAATGATSKVKNDVFGLTATPVILDENGLYPVKVLPNSSIPLRLSAEQRFGMNMSYDSVNKIFSLASGTTGDKSSIKITSTNALGQSLFGLKVEDTSVLTSAIALRGISSSPAVAVGTTPTINISNNFSVDNTNNSFVVTVDGVKGTVVIPPGNDYSLETFMSKLQKGINALATTTDGTPVTVNGVKVTYDTAKNHFVFTTGTASADSFIKISGSSNWGLDQVEAGRGTTSTWINPTQHKDTVSGTSQPKYIDGNGNETTSGDGFTTLPAWSSLYLDKGELTFDTGGKLVSPLEGTQLETVFLAGGKGALTINIDYSASTQNSSAFAVLSQSQDGAPEGDLVGVTIGNDGLVSASFSNGTQKSLAKILLTNFSSPVGLRQIGDSSFLASAASGKPILGTAGSAGFGTLRAGATERANVDLTQELVDLITAQRNFQANAKAIETSTTMTSAIINMRAG
jgi:flagellar hook-basal body protein